MGLLFASLMTSNFCSSGIYGLRLWHRIRFSETESRFDKQLKEQLFLLRSVIAVGLFVITLRELALHLVHCPSLAAKLTAAQVSEKLEIIYLKPGAANQNDTPVNSIDSPGTISCYSVVK